MSWKQQKLKWILPEEFAKIIAQNYSAKSWIYLASGLNGEVKNSHSIIALFPTKEIISDNLFELENNLLQLEKSTKNAAKFDGAWFGYVAYEYGNGIKNLPKTEKSFIDLAKIHFINFALILEFNHDQQALNAYFSKRNQLDEVLQYFNFSADFHFRKSKNLSQMLLDSRFCENDNEFIDANLEKISIKNFTSNFSDEQYLAAIDDIKNMIASGDFYQVNLTRKFFGNINISLQQDYFQLFTKLGAASPANYSSFIKFNETFIISSSPELFFTIKNGQIISRPIKGTAPRGSNLEEDKKNKNYLQNSDKEKAENLMIVDLVRNDLARVCKAGSVIVKNLFRINTYKNLHHMSSEIIGEIVNGKTVIDAFRACFPAGSMTGAPKIKAMEIIAKKEKINRGVYSGAIGYFTSTEANFSVVIRTIIAQKNKLEFQVGGAITHDSNPRAELNETKVKANAIMQVLNLNSRFRENDII